MGRVHFVCGVWSLLDEIKNEEDRREKEEGGEEFHFLFSFELICQVTSNLYHIAERRATTKCNFLFIFCLGGLESEKLEEMTTI